MLLWNAFRRSMNKEYRDVFATTVILPKLACHPLLRAIVFHWMKCETAVRIVTFHFVFMEGTPYFCAI